MMKLLEWEEKIMYVNGEFSWTLWVADYIVLFLFYAAEGGAMLAKLDEAHKR